MISCYLMSAGDKFQEYEISFHNVAGKQHIDTIMLSRPANGRLTKDTRPILYEISSIQACTIDARGQRSYCNKRGFYALNLI